MAWFIAGAVSLIGIGYAWNVVTEKFNETIKPLNDYIDKETKDAEQRILEEMRQEDMKRRKEGHEKRDSIREQYQLKKRAKLQLINNSEELCTVVYVNHYHAEHEQEAIYWAMQVIKDRYFDGQVMNKKNTKSLKLGVSNTLEIIAQELKEYHIVVKYGEQFKVLEKDSKNDIYVTEWFQVKSESVVDLNCKWKVF